MDKAKLIDLLYEVLPYVQEWKRVSAVGGSSQVENAMSSYYGNSVTLKLWEAIKTLEKWEGA